MMHASDLLRRRLGAALVGPVGEVEEVDKGLDVAGDEDVDAEGLLVE